MKNKGISLIVLIITIVVIIILGTAIIVNIAQSDLIGKANQAVVKQDFKTMQEELSLYYADQFANTKGKFKSETFNANEASTPSIYDVITSLKGSKYKGKVSVENGNIVLSDEMDEQTKEWAKEAIGVKIKNTVGGTVTASDILANPSEYYGKEVEYVVEADNLVASKSVITLAEQYDDMTWKIFYADEKNIYLIASETLKVSGKQHTKMFNTATEALSYMGTKSNWNNLVNSCYADYATGGPTITMFVNSWNAKYPSNKITLTGNDTSGWRINGELAVELQVNDSLYWKQGQWYLFNSRAVNTTVYPMQIDDYYLTSNGWAWNEQYGGENQFYKAMGYRPVICLKEGISLQSSVNGLKIVTDDEEEGEKEEIVPVSTYMNPVIPNGFEALETVDASWKDTDADGCPDGWNDGLVIVDKKGNEFVWVPVNTSSYAYDKKVYVETENGSTESGIWDEYQEDILPNGVENENHQIIKYGGFYISRYEAGIPSNSTSPENIVGAPVSKQGATVWTNISYNNAKRSAESMYNNEYVKSGLLTVTAQLTVGEWNESKNMIKWEYATSYGNYQNSTAPANINGYGSKQTAGYSKFWKINNIYDFYGNVSELVNIYDDFYMFSFDENYTSYMNDTETFINTGCGGIYKENLNDEYGFRIMLFIP